MPPLTGAGEEMAGGFDKDAAPMALPLPEVSLRALVNNVGNGISAARFFEWRRSESSRGSAHGGAKSCRVSRRSSFKGNRHAQSPEEGKFISTCTHRIPERSMKRMRLA